VFNYNKAAFCSTHLLSSQTGQFTG